VALKQQFRRIALASVAALAVAAPAACQAQPGVALRVGEVVYTEQDVTRMQANLNRVLEIAQVDAAYTAVEVVQMLVQAERFRELLTGLDDAAWAEAAQPPSVESFNEQIGQMGFDSAVADEIKNLNLSPTERDLLLGTSYNAVVNAIDQGLVTTEEASQLPAGAELNPRYGAVDQDSGLWEEPSYPWAVPTYEPEADSSDGAAEQDAGQ
jgi:hypothetical protein